MERSFPGIKFRKIGTNGKTIQFDHSCSDPVSPSLRIQPPLIAPGRFGISRVVAGASERRLYSQAKFLLDGIERIRTVKMVSEYQFSAYLFPTELKLTALTRA